MYRRRCYRSQESTSESHASIRRSLSIVQQRDQQTRRESIKNPLLQGRETTVSWMARNFDALAGIGYFPETPAIGDFKAIPEGVQSGGIDIGLAASAFSLS